MRNLKKLAYLKPLLLWLLVVGMVWFALQFHTSTFPNGMPKLDDSIDLALLALLALGSGALVIVTLVGTRVWTVRGIGLFGIFVGDFLVWSTIFISRVRHLPTPEGVSDVLRAAFLVSTPLVLYGIAGYLGESRSLGEKTNKRQDIRESEQNVRETFQGEQAVRISRRQSAREDRLDARQVVQDDRQIAQDTRDTDKDELP